MKLNSWEKLPEDYTGVIEWESGNKSWYKNGKHHREDGPSFIVKDGYKAWRLNGQYIWNSNYKIILTNQIILSKTKHPEYPTVQVWKIFDSEGIYEQTVIPGM